MRRPGALFLLALLLVLCVPSLVRAEIRVCVRLPGHPKMDQWALSGSATVMTQSWQVFTAKTNGLTTFAYDPWAPPENVRFLPPPYNKLQCPKPPPRPKPAPSKSAPKDPAEENKAGAAPAAEASESPKPAPQAAKDEQVEVVPPGVKKMPERPPEKPRPAPPPPEGVLSNEPLLPSTSTLPKKDDVHPPKCVDEHCTLVDRGGALPERVFRPGAPVSSVASCEQTKEGCKGNGKGTGDGEGDGEEKTTAEQLAEELAFLAAMVDGNLNEDTKQADGKRSGIIGGQNPDGFDNPVAQTVASLIALSAAGKAEARAFFKKLRQAAKNKTRLVLTEADLSEDMAKLLSNSKVGPAIADTLHSLGAIGPYKLMGKFTKGRGGQWEAHHIFETAKMRDFGFDPKDGPCVLLTKEQHIAIGKQLREATKRLPEDLKKSDVWKMYQKVYKDSPHWLKAIESYFAD
ncbi:hypothetical protein [Polyangium jinanense]|uniref:Uncharacterized protein n=1 Tax=Polyangium jinanense TaxID=2829994 RepID=A0A9X4AUG3_9BACT|nr:hypothetical protein [Polyangium jinanense]MDC3958781.1 hypothetical protein [Polyangium jinanense]MDC3985238.1 hypothetical protein [Polyangium jinanense]